MPKLRYKLLFRILDFRSDLYKIARFVTLVSDLAPANTSILIYVR